jgi:hypothetical protein
VQVKVGSVIIVGREHMHVVSKKGDIVQVQRQTPGEILSLVAWHLSQKNYADSMAQGKVRDDCDSSCVHVDRPLHMHVNACRRACARRCGHLRFYVQA